MSDLVTPECSGVKLLKAKVLDSFLSSSAQVKP